MRKFSICNPEQNEIVTEDELREQYWPYWYGKMCEKYGKEYVDSKFDFEDCLMDWKIVHWATDYEE